MAAKDDDVVNAQAEGSPRGGALRECLMVEEGQPPLSMATERAVVRKIDMRLIPFLSICYLAAYLDRSNLANARIVNNGEMSREIRLRDSDMQLAISMFYMGYVLFEVPSNFMLKFATPRLWISRIMLTWGIACCCLGAIQNATGLILLRVLLGIFEAGFFPGVVLFMTFWYRPEERSWRIGLFSSASAIANSLGALFSWGITHMGGFLGLSAWRWIFIVEGLPTIICGLICYFYLPNYPETARFLNENERRVLVRRLQGAEVNKKDDKCFDSNEFTKTLRNPRLLLMCICGFSFLTPLLGYTYSLPMIITKLGYRDLDAQLMTAPVYVGALLASLVTARVADKYESRSGVIFGTCFGGIIGYLGIIFFKSPELKYVSIFLTAMCLQSIGTPILAWLTIALRGSTSSALSTGLVISCGNAGGIAAGYMYPESDGPEFLRGNLLSIGMLVICMASAFAMRIIQSRNGGAV